MNLEDLKVEKELKIIYMGTPDFSATILSGLLKEYKIRAIVTQPDRPSGRGDMVHYSPVKKLAIENAILTLQPEKIKDAIDEILALEPDLIITCAYGQILPKKILDYPRLGCINVHASLLPKLRGGAPIHRAIINGYKETGVTIMYMDERMDEGDIISSESLSINDNDTAEMLHDKLMVMGRDLLLKTLPSILDGTNSRIKQDDSKATYGFVIKREDEKLDFSKTQKEVYNKIRGLNSWPGAYCQFEGKIIKVWECYKTDNYFGEKIDGEITNIYKDGIGVKVSNGEIVLTVIQPEGKKRMLATDFANGMANKESIIGKIFS